MTDASERARALAHRAYYEIPASSVRPVQEVLAEEIAAALAAEREKALEEAEKHFERLRDEGYEAEETHAERGEHGDAAIANIRAGTWSDAAEEIREMRRAETEEKYPLSRGD